MLWKVWSWIGLEQYRVKYYADLVTRKPDLEKFYFGWFRRENFRGIKSLKKITFLSDLHDIYYRSY